jgi:cytochrome c oxidase cbb3-type subunit I/II
MVRPFRSEVERYGEYSKSGESVYDHPFQWGSRRTGPDLAREGVKGGKLYKPDAWHYEHLVNPQKTNLQSIMPAYPWLAKKEIDIASTPGKIKAMRSLGVPYPAGFESSAVDDLNIQAKSIAAGLQNAGIQVDYNRQIIALIAYMQRLGTDVSATAETGIK